MNQKNIAIAAILAAALLTGIFATNPMAVYASSDGDESETNTEQRLKQKNVGSGESTNFNCGENSIDGGFIDAQLCGTVGADGGGGDGGQVQVTICHIPPGNPEQAETRSVPASAVPGHLGHGDTLGPCVA
jgi:hypothetical protein